MEERDRLSALVHLYRGELGRMTSYRVRLDTTTNWAVGTTAALGSFTLGATSTPQFVLLPLVLLLLFLWIESRRYRSYLVSLERVRLLETGMYAPLLDQKEDSSWQQQLAQNLRQPKAALPLWQAAGIRLRRNYLGLVLVVVAAWLSKAIAAGGLVAGAVVGAIPGEAILAVVGITTTAMAALAVLAPRCPSEDCA